MNTINQTTANEIKKNVTRDMLQDKYTNNTAVAQDFEEYIKYNGLTQEVISMIIAYYKE